MQDQLVKALGELDLASGGATTQFYEFRKDHPTCFSDLVVFIISNQTTLFCLIGLGVIFFKKFTILHSKKGVKTETVA